MYISVLVYAFPSFLDHPGPAKELRFHGLHWSPKPPMMRWEALKNKPCPPCEAVGICVGISLPVVYSTCRSQLATTDFFVMIKSSLFVDGH